MAADAVLRGPVAHLGLAQRLRDADDAGDTSPATAAAGYGEVADALMASPYAPHAARIRARQADALHAAGDAAGAVAAELSVMAAALSSGDPGQALIVAHRLGDRQAEVPEHLVRAVRAMSALAAYEHDPNATLDTAAEMFDATKPLDPYRLEASALFAEHATASRRHDLIAERIPLLADVADTAALDDAGRLANARLRACIADATGDWGDLAREARTGYPPRVAALLLARYGRHLAMTQQPEAAIERYNDAIERACEASAYADAADWLFAIRLIRIRYGIGVLTGDINDLYRLALALRAAGNDSVMPAPFSPRERALSALHDNDLPEALEALYRYRWRSVTLASWADEQEADARLGELYEAAGEPLQAIGHFLAAGEADKLKELAERLPDATLPLPVPADLPGRPPWERAAAFAFAGDAADFLTDSVAVQWAAAALAEITEPKPVPVLTRDPSLDACTAFGRLSDATTEGQAHRFLELASAWVKREPDHYRYSDEAHAGALVGIAIAHPRLRPVAVDQMCQVLIADQRMGGIVLSRGRTCLRAEPAIVAARCGPAVGDGNVRAALAIVLSGADMTAVIPLAQEHLDAVAKPRTHLPGHYDYSGGWQEIAVLSIALDPVGRARLADTMIAVIEDREDVGWNRGLALEALAAIGRHLDDAHRDCCFPVALAAARGEQDGSAGDDLFTTGPLNRVRTGLGPGTLRYNGLLAAAALAHAPGQYAAVVALAQELMPHAGAHEANRIAGALVLLPAGQAGLDPLALAAHGSEWIRALAAAVWCTTGGQPTLLGLRLAADSSVHVRRTLAAHLPDRSVFDEPRAILLNDIRRSVRTVIRGGPA